mmetsp:Transcript_22075/g.53453  ORF Transcript_22075/g.53453 Transcript_22075/m.53453 type:complete len:133 (+) Transcript_22075:1662-2060(+)
MPPKSRVVKMPMFGWTRLMQWSLVKVEHISTGKLGVCGHERELRTGPSRLSCYRLQKRGGKDIVRDWCGVPKRMHRFDDNSLCQTQSTIRGILRRRLESRFCVCREYKRYQGKPVLGRLVWRFVYRGTMVRS